MKTLLNSPGFWMVAVLTLVAGGCVVGMRSFENSMIYFPMKYPLGDWEAASRSGEDGVRIEDCEFSAADGVRLHAWMGSLDLERSAGSGRVKLARSLGGRPRNRRGVLLHAAGEAEGGQRREGADFTRLAEEEMVILWFHGNAGNITNRYDMMTRLIRLPARVLLVDYRGYGKSGGSPSEEGLYLDARAAWDYLTVERRVPASRIVILGKSLGGAVAVDLASKVNGAGLIVQSSFTSAADVAAAVMPFVPRFLLRTKFDSKAKISRVRCPKLFIHSPADEVIPYDLGRRLYEAAPAGKEFYEIPEAPHNETYLIGGEAYLETVRRFLGTCGRFSL